MTKAANSAVQIRPVINGRRWSHLLSNSTLSVTNISRGITPTVTSGTAANVSSSDYSSPCRSSGFPQVIEWDLSSVSSVNRDDVVLIWRAHDGYNLIDTTQYNNVDSYKVQAWNGSAWTDIYTVTGNTYIGRSHRVSGLLASGYTKLRMNCTVSLGSAGNADFDTKIDLYGLSGSGALRGCIHVGDSLIANGFALKPNFGQSDLSFGQQVYNTNGKYTPELMIAQGGSGTTRWSDNLSEFNAILDSTDIDTVWINYGTNADSSATVFETNLTTIVNAAQAKSKRVVIDYLVGNTSTTHASAYNAKIAAVIAAKSCLFGVDYTTYFANNPAKYNADGIHLTDAGSVDFRAMRAARFAALS